MDDKERFEIHQKMIRVARLRGFGRGSLVPISVLQELLFESWVDFQAGRGDEPVLVYAFVVPIVSPIEWRYRIVYHNQTLVAIEWHPIGAVPLGIKKVLVDYIATNLTTGGSPGFPPYGSPGAAGVAFG